MKKLVTTLIFAFASMVCTCAQIQFIDHDGNVIPDGSEIMFMTPDAELLQYGMIQIPMELNLKNVGDAPVDCTIEFNVTHIDTDNGSFYCCAFGDCVQFNKIGTLTKGPVSIEAGSIDTTLRQTEWSAKSETSYGKVQFTVTASSASESTSVNVTLEYADPTSVSNPHSAENVTETARYSVSGQRIYQPQHGINIIHYNDGTTKKIIIK